jgi:quercetin dioxygenase-like cupin family protein
MLGIDRFPEFVTSLSEVELPFAGARGWLIQGDRNQVVFVEFAEAVDVPEHSHQEQWEIVLSGFLVLCMDGKKREYRAGEAFFVSAGTPHAASVQAGYRAVIVFNEPGRYRAE